MHFPYNIETHDNLIAPELNEKIYQYVKDLEFTGIWKPSDEVIFNYSLNSPRSPGDWMLYKSMDKPYAMHRAALASDEDNLKIRHLPIYLLWKEINRKLDNQFELTGNPEGMISTLDIPPTSDPSLEAGWRAYVNLSYNSQVGGGAGSIHRDTPLEFDDPTTVTMLYVISPEWYPSWGADIRYYPEDPEGATGDRQQFSRQHRKYNIGWLDQGKTVSPVPGRLIIYDGRCLHATSPANGPIETPSIKIAFRARRKK